MNLFARLVKNPKTTIGGTVVGAALMTAGALIIQQAQCDFSQVQWMAVIGSLFAGPAVMGGLSTDNGGTVGK